MKKVEHVAAKEPDVFSLEVVETKQELKEEWILDEHPACGHKHVFEWDDREATGWVDIGNGLLTC